MNQQQNCVIGIDLGGTQMRAARIEGDKLILEKRKSTPKNTTHYRDTTDVLIELIQSVWSDQVTAIGIGVPSVVDREKGIVYYVVHIPHWDEVPLKTILEKQFGVPVYVDNDANCFALGERIFGAGKNCENFVGLTIGTGLGGGIIQRGRLLADANCGSGEFGMLPYLDAVLEYYCSGSFFMNCFGIDGKEMHQMALENKKEALEAYRQLGEHLAAAVKMVVLTVDPEMIIFGGSVAESHAWFEAAMHENLKDFAYPNSIKRLRLEFSRLQHPGLFGAASLCYANL